MKFNVSIKNLGKINEGEVSLNRLTLFCGPNNTGKSYVSKALYSMFRAINSNHGWNLIGEEVDKLNGILALDFQQKVVDPVLLEIRELANIPPQLLARDDDNYAKRVRAIAKNKGFSGKSLCDRFAKITDNALKNNDASDEIRAIKQAVRRIKKFSKLSQEEMFEGAVKAAVPNLLKGNFMAHKISELSSDSQEGFGLDIKGIINLSVTDEVCKISYGDMSKIRKVPLVLYLDGVEVKIDSGLVRNIAIHSARHKRAPIFPYYLSDFLGTLEEQPVTSNDLSKTLKYITTTIGGKLDYEEGRFYFDENKEGRIRASLASTGVRQLGTLGLLIERGLLLENSMVFIDEPETNLYPEWQRVMAQVLIQLALQGINIVVATHSSCIVQYMKYFAGENKEFNDILAVNYYSKFRTINEELKGLRGNYEKLRFIQGELDKTHMETLMRGVIGG